MNTLGEFLVDARRAKALTLRVLAPRIGVSPSYISDTENGRRIPSEDVLRRLSAELGVEFADVMAHACRLTEKAERWMKRHPAAFKLIEALAEHDTHDLMMENFEKIATGKWSEITAPAPPPSPDIRPRPPAPVECNMDTAPAHPAIHA